MDDPLVSRAYAYLRERWPRFNFSRSGLVTTSILALLLVVFGVVWQAHQRAQFHRLRTPVVLPDAPVLLPGGLEAITLSRMALLNGTAPEFVSATVLPGLGMQVLQITIAVPDQGTRPLLLAPSVGEIAGAADPQLESAPFHLRVLPRHGVANKSAAETDLIGNRSAENVQNVTLPDGGHAEGIFPSSVPGDGPTGMETSVSTSLSGRDFDVTVRATNNSSEIRSVALDWSPRFRVPGGSLSHFALVVPSQQRLDGTAVRTVVGTPQDFSAERGTKLQNRNMDLTYVNLKRTFLGDGPVLRLLDLESGITLRMTALSTSIRSIRVHSDATQQALTLSFSNADAGASAADNEAQMLRPGQTLQWHLRVEVLPTAQVSAGSAAQGSGGAAAQVSGSVVNSTAVPSP